MKNVLKLVAVIGVAFALAGCDKRWSEEPLVEGNFDPELSEYMNKNLPAIKIEQGEKIYLDVQDSGKSREDTGRYVVRVFVDGEPREISYFNKKTSPRGSGVTYGSMEGAVIEYSDADGYKIQPGEYTWDERDISRFIRSALIDGADGQPNLNISPKAENYFN
jgi:hypothetical protein